MTTLADALHTRTAALHRRARPLEQTQHRPRRTRYDLLRPTYYDRPTKTYDLLRPTRRPTTTFHGLPPTDHDQACPACSTARTTHRRTHPWWWAPPRRWPARSTRPCRTLSRYGTETDTDTCTGAGAVGVRVRVRVRVGKGVLCTALHNSAQYHTSHLSA